jgi:RNA polymerase sigma-70 factor (family 1)
MEGIGQEEFDSIFKQWYAPIRNFLYYRSGDVNVAEDITQDTFLKVWEKKEKIRPETVKYLLYKIATNLLINKKEHDSVSFKFLNKIPGNGTSESADFELEMKEFDARLQKALSELDDKKRTAFLMNRIDGFTYTEIAENLGITVKAVEKRIEKALGFLNNKIAMKL